MVILVYLLIFLLLVLLGVGQRTKGGHSTTPIGGNNHRFLLSFHYCANFKDYLDAGLIRYIWA